MRVRELLNADDDTKWMFIRGLDIEAILDYQDKLESYMHDANYASTMAMFDKRVEQIEYDLTMAKETAQVEKHVVHINLNFTDEEGNNLGTWGPGSKGVRRVLGDK